MDSQEQSILCPDCGVNYITISRLNEYKKCISCSRRETIANTKNAPYIKWVDLSEDEKRRLEKQREKNNRIAKNSRERKNKLKKRSRGVKVSSLSDIELVRKFLISKGYLDTNISFKTTDMYDKFSLYCSINHFNVISRQELYHILIAEFNFIKKKVYGTNYIYRVKSSTIANNEKLNIDLKSDGLVANIKTDTVRANQIYTPDMIEYLLSIADNTKTVSDLREALIKRFPDKRITASNFNNIIARRKIPHYVNRGFALVRPVEDAVKVVKDEPIKIIKDEPVEKVVTIPEIVEKQTIEKSSISSDRLSPIKDEVIKVLQTKFTAMKCKTINDFTIDDYINMIELFIYLMHTVDNIISVRNNQYDITNWYQDEIIHEMENELAEDGNTYLQDKMYVLRDIRRYIESDRDALKQMRVFLKNLTKSFPEAEAKKVVGQLKHISRNIKQPKFIPTVDLGMVNKYSWATYGSPSSAKNSKTALTTNAIEKFINEKADEIKTVNINGTKTHLSKEEIDRGFKVYRVSCNISGGGYGAFKPWYKDYPCVNQEIAMSFAQQEFARMKASNSSLLFTDVKVHQLNVV